MAHSFNPIYKLPYTPALFFQSHFCGKNFGSGHNYYLGL